MFPADAQDSAELKASAIFFKDQRLRPLWRAVIYPVAVTLAASILWALFLGVSGRPAFEQFTFSVLIANEFFAAIGAVVAAILLRRYLDRRSIASLGFAPRGPWLRLFGLGIALGAGMQAIAYMLEAVPGYARVVGHGSFASDAKLVLVAAIVFLAAALFEEMSLRGYLLQNLWEEWGVAPAIIVTSILFALIHFTNPHAREQSVLTIAGLSAFALWACFSLLWTKSLWVALGGHMAWNVFEGPIFGFPVSGEGIPVPTVLSQSVHGPQWLTGGAFGPEAGASSIIATLIGLAVLRLLYVKGAFSNVADSREAYARVSESFVPSTSDRDR